MRIQAKEVLSIWIQHLERYRSILQKAGIFIGGGLILYQLAQSIISIIAKSVVFYHPFFIVIPILLFPIAAFQQMVAWKLIMSGLQVKIPLISIIQSYSYSFLPRYIPGTIWGYLSRAEWLFQRHQVEFGKTNFGSLVEIEIGVASSLSIIGVFYFYLRRELAFPIIIGLLILIVAPWLLSLAWDNIKGQSVTFALALKQIVNWMGSLILYALNGIYYGVGLLSIVQVLSPYTILFSPTLILTFAAFYNLAWLIGFLILFVPSGLGIRELVLTSLITASLQGTSQMANSAAVIMRLLIILFAEISWIGLGLWIKARKPSTR